MPKRRRKREQPMMHPSCRPQQQPQHFLWGCIMRCKVATGRAPRWGQRWKFRGSVADGIIRSSVIR